MLCFYLVCVCVFGTYCIFSVQLSLLRTTIIKKIAELNEPSCGWESLFVHTTLLGIQFICQCKKVKSNEEMTVSRVNINVFGSSSLIYSRSTSNCLCSWTRFPIFGEIAQTVYSLEYKEV